MDNSTLQSVLSDSTRRNFWIKTIGLPGKEPDLHELYNQSSLTVEFSRQPFSIEIGDILIIHKIAISKVVYIAECQSAPREVTAEEIKQQSFKEHWNWTMGLRNLTPIYGMCWAKYNIKPFTLVKRYNELFPKDKQSLGSLQYGGGHLQISSKFGTFLLQKIMDLRERIS
jgi:hypothetical protein